MIHIRKSTKALIVQKVFIKRNIITIGLLLSAFLIGSVSLITYYGQNVGNFVMSVDDNAKGLELSETVDFLSPSSRLFAGSKRNMIDSTYDYINRKGKIDSIRASEGDYGIDSKEYIAYSFYIRNSGTQTVDMRVVMDLLDSEKELYKATRILFFAGNVHQGLYAYTDDTMRDKAGNYPEVIEYQSDEVVFSLDIMNVKRSDEPMKFTIIMWIEGWDPDNEGRSMLGGNVKYGLTFSIIN